MKPILLEKTIPKASKIIVAGDEYETLDNDKIKIKFHEANELAYINFVLSIETSTSAKCVAFNIGKRSKSSDYPDGIAQVTWQGLQRKFAPTTAPTVT
jgi:hypothetical protein